MFNIIHFETIDSTNNYAKNNIENLNHYDLILADFQTAGRGRRDHRWIAKSKQNIMASIVLKDPIEMSIIQQITQVVAVSILEVCHKYHMDAMIKWPNDIYVGDKKLCGILIETVFIKELKGIVVGTGINVKQNELDNATSFCDYHPHLEIEEVLNQYLQQFHINYQNFLDGKYIEILEKANQHSYLEGKEVNLFPYGQVKVGKLLEDGTIEIIHSKQILYKHVNEFSLSKD